MKKVVFFLVIVCLFLSVFQVAYADSIFAFNDFFNRNQQHIVYLGRHFTANSADGYVPIMEEPGALRAIGTIDNGEVVYMEFSCLYDGDYWGLTYVPETDRSEFGWVRLSEFLVLYDYVAFEEDHIDEIYTYTGNPDEIARTGAVVVWAWPGSGIPLWTIEDVNVERLSITFAYMDETGLEWGFIWSFGNIWVCLSDPLNKDLPMLKPAPEPTMWVSDTVHKDIAKSDDSTLVLAIALVGGLVVTSALLILFLFKRRERS